MYYGNKYIFWRVISSQKLNNLRDCRLFSKTIENQEKRFCTSVTWKTCRRFPGSLPQKFANASFWTLTERPRWGAICPPGQTKGATKCCYISPFDSFDSLPGADTWKTIRYFFSRNKTPKAMERKIVTEKRRWGGRSLLYTCLLTCMLSKESVTI